MANAWGSKIVVLAAASGFCLGALLAYAALSYQARRPPPPTLPLPPTPVAVPIPPPQPVE